MLEFILGGSKSGKSTHVTQRIEKLISSKTVEFDIKSNSGEQIILIVPEQFTYETERALFEKLGGPAFLNVKVTSFTRLAIEIFQQFGGMANDYADDCAKIVLMNKAIRACLSEEQLVIYKKTAQYTNFTTKMIATINELKLSGINYDDFDNITFEDKNEYLGQKSSEIAKIFTRYEAELNASPYIDQSDDLIRALEVVKQEENIHYIKGKHIFIDEFKGFTKSEKDFIALMTQKANVYMTLCIDNERKNDQLSPFVSILKTKDEIMKLVTNSGEKIKQTKLEPFNDRNEVLHHIEQNIFALSPNKFAGTKSENSIKAVACLNEFNEFEYVLSTIKLLVKNEGYAYNDIAIIARDTKPYEDIYANLAEKHEIPVFYDEVNSVVDMSIIKFVQAFLACVSRMSSENILTLLKCQLFDSKIILKNTTSINDFTLSKISNFENYLYVWGISGAEAFSKEFEQNPAGFKAEFTEAETRELKNINKIRDFCYTCINDFKTVTKDANGFKFCIELLKAIENMGVKQKFQKQVYVNLKNGDTQTADKLSIVWEIFNELLSTLGNIIGNEKVVTKNFSELFHLVAASYDLGSVPSTLDSVTFGDAERIRVTNKKAVFVLSVNDGVFPATPSSGSLFTSKDRDVLSELEMPIPRLGIEAIQEERFIAYKTLTSATEKLYVTARSSNAKGEALIPSSIFDELTDMFGDSIIVYANELADEYYCHTNATTVKQFLFSNDKQGSKASLKEVLTNTDLPETATNKVLLDDIYNLTSETEFELSPEIALELFKSNIGLSPTQIENYYKCPFMYFCKHGLKVKELRKAKIDPSNAGSLIHQVLENIVKTLDFTNAFDKVSIDNTIKAEISNYVNNQMGGTATKTNRFNYICNRMITPLSIIVKRIYDEFSGAKFTPHGYEAEIGSSDDLPALELKSKKGTINVTGSIDRVDIWHDQDSDNTYVRVVDYKSGTKKFDLNEVCHGLNLQMLIYLLAITENGQGDYEDSKPAGILYMPSGEKSPVSLESLKEDESTKSKFVKQYQMNGLLIANEKVINAMEVFEKKPEYIPDTAKSCISEYEFNQLNNFLKEQVVEMVDSLHDGKIPATPIDGDNKPCRYCKYESVCNFKNVRDFNKNKYKELFSSDDSDNGTNETDETNEVGG